MSTPAFDAYRQIVVVNSDRVALELGMKLRDASEESRREAFSGRREAGFFYLYRRDDMHTDSVMEVVVSTDGDAITSVYKNHRAFASGGALIEARMALIKALAEKIGLPPESVGIDDSVRGRALHLQELSTGQLLDLLAEKEGKTLVRTDSYAGNVVGGPD